MNFSGFSVLREYFNSGDGLGKDSALYTLVQLSPSTPASAVSTPHQGLRDRSKIARFALLRHVTQMAGSGPGSSWALPLVSAASMPLSERHPMTAVTCALSPSGSTSLLQLMGLAAAPRASTASVAPQSGSVIDAVAALSPEGSALRGLSAMMKAPRNPAASFSSVISAVAELSHSGSALRGLSAMIASPAAPAASTGGAAPPPASVSATASKAAPVDPPAAKPSRTLARYELINAVATISRGTGLTALYRQVCFASSYSFAVPPVPAGAPSAAAAAAAAAAAPSATAAPMPAAAPPRPPAPPKPPADPRPIPLRPPKHTSSPFQYHSRCSGGALGFVFIYTMALETDKPPLISLLTCQASAPPRDVEAAKLATITAVRSGRSVSDAERTVALAATAAMTAAGSPLSSVAPFVPLGGEHQSCFFGLRCLHDAVGLIQASSPIPIYSRVPKDTAWAVTSTRDTVAIAAKLSGASARRNPTLPLVRGKQPSPPESSRWSHSDDGQPQMLPTRPKGTALRINRRIAVLQAEIAQLVRSHDERAARNLLDAQKGKQSPRSQSPRSGGVQNSSAKSEEQKQQWVQTPQVSLRRESVAGGNATPQRPTLPPARRASIAQSHVLDGGLGSAVAKRNVPPSAAPAPAPAPAQPAKK